MRVTGYLIILLVVSACGTTQQTSTVKSDTPSNQDQYDKKPPTNIVTYQQEEPTPAVTMEDVMPSNPKASRILLETKFGNMVIELFDETPQHRDNFLKLIKEEYFHDLLFHRVIPDFMIQGGDPESRDTEAGTALGRGGPGYTIPAEFNTKFLHYKGVLSAARQGDHTNPQKESSGSQFYIVQGKKQTVPTLNRIETSTGKMYSVEQRELYQSLGGTPHLDHKYTVFGRVVEGIEVIDKIAKVPTEKQIGDRPVEDVKMKITLIK